MRNFGDNYRLLKSNERLTLWNMLCSMDSKQFEGNPYFKSLDKYKAKLDNVDLIL